MTEAAPSSPDFSLVVDGVQGLCPPGEKWAKENLRDGKIPVLSCEGPCVRGDIARRAANLVAEEEPYARCCYQEASCVPYSAMARWVKEAERTVMIDGCFLTCLGRIMKNLVDEKRMIHIDALALHKQYSDVFHMDAVPEADRARVARGVADKILTKLREEHDQA